MHFFVGKYDSLADPTDAAAGYAKLPAASQSFYKEYDLVDHFSFMVGKTTAFNADLLKQIAAVSSTEEVEEQLPMDYPFVEDADLNLY